MDNKLGQIGDLYAELGGAIVQKLGPGDHQVVAYVEAGDHWTGISVYHNEEDRVVFFGDIDDLEEFSEIVLDIWYTEDPDKRWTEMQLDIDGTRFQAKQIFAEQLDSRESYDIRRERAVRERFGDKPIYYPPLPAD